MESEFNHQASTLSSHEWQPIDSKGSGKFQFFKARIHGRLHFVKALADSSRHDLQAIAALKKEFEIGYNLDHPAIVHYLHYENDAIYEEFIDGKSLYQLISEDDLILKEKSFLEGVARQLLEAVEYIHARGVLHLDLKLENVMITRVGRNVKIIDFGCAYSSMYDTTQGFTLEYKAPEQSEGETNAYTDIYLIGRIMEKLGAHTGNLSQWRKFISKASSENPADRFRTEQEAIAAIPKGKSKKSIFYGAAAVIAVIALMGFFYMPFSSKEEIADSSIEANSTHTPQDSVNPDIKEPDAIQQNNIPSSPSPSSPATPTPSASIENQAASTPTNQPKDIRAWLDRTITDHIAADYLKNVKPYCQADEVTSEVMEKVQDQMAQARGRSFKLADELVAKYPQEEAFIRDRVYSSINAQQSQTGVWLYGEEELSRNRHYD